MLYIPDRYVSVERKAASLAYFEQRASRKVGVQLQYNGIAKQPNGSWAQWAVTLHVFETGKKLFVREIVGRHRATVCQRDSVPLDRFGAYRSPAMQ